MLVRDFNPHLGTKDDVIREHMGLARAVAGRFRWATANAGHIDFQDIVSEAYIGLLKAFDKFDGRVPKFTNYAVPMMQWEIQQFIQRKGQPISVPQKLYSLLGQIFRNDLVCAPVPEIVAKLGCGELEAARALKYLKESRSVSLDQPVMSPKDGTEEGCLHDLVGQAPDLTIAHVDDFLDGLDPEERHFVQMREAGDRSEMPLLQTAVRTKLMAYMGLDESEVNQMSVELTKDKYLELRAQGRSDASIYDEYDMGQTAFYRRKSKWGLVGTGQLNPAARKKNRAVNTGNVMRTTRVSQEPPVAAGEEDWKAKYHALSRDYANSAGAATTIERLKQEVGLLKVMLKFYLEGAAAHE